MQPDKREFLKDITRIVNHEPFDLIFTVDDLLSHEAKKHGYDSIGIYAAFISRDELDDLIGDAEEYRERLTSEPFQAGYWTQSGWEWVKNNTPRDEFLYDVPVAFKDGGKYLFVRTWGGGLLLHFVETNFIQPIGEDDPIR